MIFKYYIKNIVFIHSLGKQKLWRNLRLNCFFCIFYYFAISLKLKKKNHLLKIYYLGIIHYNSKLSFSAITTLA